MKNWLIFILSVLCLGLVVQEILTYGFLDSIIYSSANLDIAIFILSIISVLGFFYLWKNNFFQRNN